MENRVKSPILAYAKRMLQDAIDRIDNDECSEEAVEYMVRRTNAETNGYYNNQSFVNYDEAMRILNIGNRLTLQQRLKRNGIAMQRLKNKPVGFLRSEVEGLAQRGEMTRKKGIKKSSPKAAPKQ